MIRRTLIQRRHRPYLDKIWDADTRPSNGEGLRKTERAISARCTQSDRLSVYCKQLCEAVIVLKKTTEKHSKALIVMMTT